MESENLENVRALKYKDAIEVVDNFLKKIELKDIKMQEMLYILNGSHVDELISSLEMCRLPNSYFSYKDFLRAKLKEKYELKSSDDIFFLEDGIYIKFFLQVETEDAKDRRACGIEPSLLEEYKKTYFEHDSYKEEVFSIISLVYEDVLNFRKITPIDFKKMFISTFVNMVEIIVIQNMDIEDVRTIRGMSFYLLRELFDDILGHIAEDILFHFANKDRKAEEFLGYFSVHETIDKKGVRHKPNPILDDSNHAWNMTTIRSTMLQHKRAKQAIYDKKNALNATKKKLIGYKKEQRQYFEGKKQAQENFELANKAHENLQKTIDKVQVSNSEKVKFLDAGVEKVFDKKPLLAKLFKKEDDLITEKNAIKRLIDDWDTKISNKQKEIDIWERKYIESKELLANIEKTGHPTDKQYESIKKALAKTLAKR